MPDRWRHDRAAMAAAIANPASAVDDPAAARARTVVREVAIASLDRVVADGGHRAMLVKGAALAATHHRPRWARPMGDIDLLALDAEPLHRALLASGLEPIADGRTHSAAALGERKLWLDLGRVRQLVELHHDFDKIAPRPIDYVGLFARAHVLPGARALRAPCDEDHVLLVALHAARSDFDHPVAWLDLAALFARDLDWDAIAARAAAWEARVAMHVVLRTLGVLSPQLVPPERVARFPIAAWRRRLLDETYALGAYPVVRRRASPGVDWVTRQLAVHDAPATWARGVARYTADRLREKVAR